MKKARFFAIFVEIDAAEQRGRSLEGVASRDQREWYCVSQYD